MYVLRTLQAEKSTRDSSVIKMRTSPRAPVAVDAMGGDLGLGAAVDGSIRAWRELGIASILVGDESAIARDLKARNAFGESGISIKHASEVITMEDTPSIAIRRKPDASIRVAFELAAEGKASSVVSPGNTGAVMAAGLFVSGVLPGIARPAIASLIPKVGDLPPSVLLDSGANIDCDAFQLVQFALMGNYYAQVALPCDRPRIALLSNGTEPSKGNDIIRSAALTLSQMKDLNFIGFVEGRDIPRDVADVIVVDGFVGNVVLKSMEGSVELIVDSIKAYIEKSIRGRIGIWIARPLFKSLFRDKLDPSSHGGAPLLGLNDLAIVCHGSSNARAIMNAIRVADRFVKSDLIPKMEQSLDSLDFKKTVSYEDGLWERMGKRFDKKKKWGKGAAEDEETHKKPQTEQKTES